MTKAEYRRGEEGRGPTRGEREKGGDDRSRMRNREGCEASAAREEGEEGMTNAVDINGGTMRYGYGSLLLYYLCLHKHYWLHPLPHVNVHTIYTCGITPSEKNAICVAVSQFNTCKQH